MAPRGSVLQSRPPPCRRKRQEKSRSRSAAQGCRKVSREGDQGWGAWRIRECSSSGATGTHQQLRAYVTPFRPFPKTRLEDVAGCLPWHGKPITIEQMKKGI